MNTDHLQKFIFSKINEVKKLTKDPLNGSPDYKRAIEDVITLLDKERTQIIEAHERLKNLGLAI